MEHFLDPALCQYLNTGSIIKLTLNHTLYGFPWYMHVSLLQMWVLVGQITEFYSFLYVSHCGIENQGRNDSIRYFYKWRLVTERIIHVVIFAVMTSLPPPPANYNLSLFVHHLIWTFQNRNFVQLEIIVNCGSLSELEDNSVA